MKQMLEWQDISRQGAHQGIARLNQEKRDLLETVELASEVREKHNQMGCRDIHYAVRESLAVATGPSRYCLTVGFGLSRPRDRLPSLVKISAAT